MSLSTLPPDALRVVGSFLHPRDILSLSLTCKTFKRTLLDSTAFWWLVVGQQLTRAPHRLQMLREDKRNPKDLMIQAGNKNISLECGMYGFEIYLETAPFDPYVNIAAHLIRIQNLDLLRVVSKHGYDYTMPILRSKNGYMQTAYDNIIIRVGHNIVTCCVKPHNAPPRPLNEEEKEFALLNGCQIGPYYVPDHLI